MLRKVRKVWCRLFHVWERGPTPEGWSWWYCINCGKRVARNKGGE